MSKLGKRLINAAKSRSEGDPDGPNQEAKSWLAQFRKSGVNEVPLSEIKDDLSRYLREARRRDHIRVMASRPARVDRIESEEDWFDYRLEHDPRFLQRIEQARNSLRAGGGIRLEDVETE